MGNGYDVHISIVQSGSLCVSMCQSEYLVLSWNRIVSLAIDAARRTSRLSAAIRVESLPYDEMYGEIVEGLFDLHWDENNGAFFDYGRHDSDGEVVKEVVMRCRRGKRAAHTYISTFYTVALDRSRS